MLEVRFDSVAESLTLMRVPGGSGAWRSSSVSRAYAKASVPSKQILTVKFVFKFRVVCWYRNGLDSNSRVGIVGYVHRNETNKSGMRRDINTEAS